jgi:hypothetical protein
MRGGEVLGGYGYSEREEYMKSRGELTTTGERVTANHEGGGQQRS